MVTHDPVSEFSVGDRYRVTVFLDAQTPLALRFEWDPAMPATLSDHELADYQRGRDAALEKLVAAPGRRIAGG